MSEAALSGLATARRAFNAAQARLGAPGWLGLALGVAATFVVASNCVPMWQRNEQATHRIARLMLSAADPNRHQKAATLPPATPFVLPTLKEAPGIAAAVIRQATEHEVPIQSAEYRYGRGTDTRPPEYEMTFDLHGSYLNAREFLQDVLEDQPAVGLREAKFYLEELPSSGALPALYRTPNIAVSPPARERELRVHVRLVVFLQETA
jgi:hypothetical protein